MAHSSHSVNSDVTQPLQSILLHIVLNLRFTDELGTIASRILRICSVAASCGARQGGGTLSRPHSILPVHALQYRNTVLNRSLLIRSIMSSDQKRKSETLGSGSEEQEARQVKRLATGDRVAVHPKRVRMLMKGDAKEGPVLYWMSRDQRVEDNWALLYAIQCAQETNQHVGVVFNLVPEFMNAGARQFVFMLEGLKSLEKKLGAKKIPFFFTQGDPVQEIPKLLQDCQASALVTDFSPLRLGREWRDGVVNAIKSSGCKTHVYEVDAHNIVPVWVTSDKREYAARTIRRKITDKLSEYLREYPEVPTQKLEWSGSRKPNGGAVDWNTLINHAKKKGAAVPVVTWIHPGEDAALKALMGPQGFLTKTRLSKYAAKRNDPTVPNALSGLSPYFHFGQLSPQRAALEASKLRSAHKDSVEGFLEEMVIRRELSDNYCFYTPNYDSMDAAYDWAKETLNLHRNDVREHLYTYDQLERAKTHDDLWNAAQKEMVVTGKMHGFLRMYWAKKILEWTESPEQAIDYGIRLNDKWQLDGRDPNGYVGIMWSMCGIHDQGWRERPIFGKIRYMNYQGCKRKFDIQKYVSRVNELVRKAKS
ncbi:Deoxyribodipyrimidine photo-lyase [Picochlorum sp. SENEW3]|nr:Deoxyribodipyrimidine photo-lyase [Picochlorum sp. SENEW3]WPT14509.1 Deoxyribodipyrimidine photo-lyase [Picochlorum sp. SENEW3]